MALIPRYGLLKCAAFAIIYLTSTAVGFIACRHPSKRCLLDQIVPAPPRRSHALVEAAHRPWMSSQRHTSDSEPGRGGWKPWHRSGDDLMRGPHPMSDRARKRRPLDDEAALQNSTSSGAPGSRAVFNARLVEEGSRGNYAGVSDRWASCLGLVMRCS